MRRILVLYTGGTVGCAGAPLSPMAGEAFAAELALRGLLPAGCQLQAMAPARDSASMQPADWLDIGEHLLQHWGAFDGFVVLHGTDTLAWTAAALSYLLAGQDKPVVLTGAQHPLTAAGSDAARNMAEALVAAATPGLCEVTICFGGVLLRGNRSSKRSAQDFAAFASPRWPALGAFTDGALQSNPEACLPAPHEPFPVAERLAGLRQCRTGLGESTVAILYLHPGFSPALLTAVPAMPQPRKACLLVCYGAGNAPDSAAFLAALSALHAQGVALVAITQASHGAVRRSPYRSAEGLRAAGVVDGLDLGLEAAHAKLQILLASGLSGASLAAALQQPCAGELLADPFVM